MLKNLFESGSTFFTSKNILYCSESKFLIEKNIFLAKKSGSFPIEKKVTRGQAKIWAVPYRKKGHEGGGRFFSIRNILYFGLAELKVS